VKLIDQWFNAYELVLSTNPLLGLQIKMKISGSQTLYQSPMVMVDLLCESVTLNADGPCEQ
jgi:hypothetical protein